MKLWIRNAMFIVGLPVALYIFVFLAGSRTFRHDSASPTPPPPSINHPPIYLGAQNIEVTSIASGQQITFVTRDEPVKVFQYYKDRLLQEGWQVQNYKDAPVNSSYFEYDDGPHYRFAVEVTITSTGQTNVTLIIVTETRID
jgi:hypothetical protein